ncbi:ABC transporter ATP-binding protein [Chelatococcus reniformis]|uniref:ABC transporter ATP-binding protein n=1 Tax=Chelatococcus reniformis TaxID=1494448 RepID=A0A916UNH8_9HYPH|nr:ABC transporter ATP-binding protein [Chelatococcus reniformis]GGC80505.1 ABC transporter ATP-binding protein [Chelatococcus reniformis]
MNKLLEIKGLHAAYGQTRVLHGLDFEIEPGSVTTLLGANGAGKTTTLRAICGMVKRTGDILLNGQQINRNQTEDIVRLGVAHVPDGRGTFLRQTVEENLQLGAMARRDKAGIASDMELVYSYFPILKKRRTQIAGLLSGGEQQMLAVGRALMLRPKLMLLDEPSFGLAPMITREIFEIFRSLNRNEKVSMLLVEQNASLALELADHAYLLETGRVVFSGRAEAIREDESIRRAYLGY